VCVRVSVRECVGEKMGTAGRQRGARICSATAVDVTALDHHRSRLAPPTTRRMARGSRSAASGRTRRYERSVCGSNRDTRPRHSRAAGTRRDLAGFAEDV